jgi:leukotriene-A4 hydrolase
MPSVDPNTLSNYRSWLTKHATANFTIDFADKCLKGSVTLELESLTEKESYEIVLDSSFLAISSVAVDSELSKWELKDRLEPYGAPLHISVPGGVPKGQVVKVDVALETTSKCTALQWLTPAQTSNKKHPYMFSQCQAIHARSLFPCQDTPGVKSTFTFNITSPLPVVASGIPVTTPDGPAGEDKLYQFEQKVPIPSYLFALASGDIVTAPIGPRSTVATGPDELKESQWELKEDMERFMEVAESIVFPYKWGQYNVLVLPPSFPYGGTRTLICRQRKDADFGQAWRTRSIPLLRPQSLAETDRM